MRGAALFCKDLARAALRCSGVVTAGVVTAGASILVQAASSNAETFDAAAAGRVYADQFVTWIHEKPSADAQAIGYLRGGQSVPLQSDGRIRGSGCSAGYVAVAPLGYVCAGKAASLAPTRYAESMRALGPDAGAFPYWYGLSMGTPAYRRIPTPAEQARQERKFGAARALPLPPHWRGHEELVGGALPEPHAMPKFLERGGSASRDSEDRLVRREIPFGSMLAFTGSFESEGRRYLTNADGTIVPAERIRPFRRSTFSGVHLKGDLELPLAWTRRPTTLFTLDPSCPSSLAAPSRDGRLGTPQLVSPGCILKASGSATQSEAGERTNTGVRTRLELSGRRFRSGSRVYLEIEGGGAVDSQDVFVAEKQSLPLVQGEKWVSFSIGRGTLVAYEGERPVFATLASPGIGGVPQLGGDPLTDRTTPVGTYRIQFKHKSDDMSPEEGEHRSFFVADVPYAQYFKPPFAIHVAYWHESFGEPMSGGCINVSPLDGAWLFDWTSPDLPDGWHGVLALPAFGRGTWVHVQRD